MAEILGFGLDSDGSQIWKGMLIVYLSVITSHKVGLPMQHRLGSPLLKGFAKLLIPILLALHIYSTVNFGIDFRVELCI